MQENDNLVQLQDENGKDVNFEHLMTIEHEGNYYVVLDCLLYTSPSPRDRQKSRMPSSA